jgi:hypothetical protein
MATELDVLRKACLTPGNLGDYYSIGRVIGKGGFAVVREGTVKKNGNTVALKLLNPKGSCVSSLGWCRSWLVLFGLAQFGLQGSLPHAYLSYSCSLPF